MSVTVAELITPPTRAELKDQILASLEVVGFPVTSWQPGSIPVLIVEGLADVLVSAWEVVAAFARGAYGATAEAEWLDLWALDRFQITREAARATTGTVTLTDAGGGAHNVAAGGLIVSTDDGRRFISTAAVTVPLNGSATVTVQAAETGSTYNVPVGTITTLVTDLPSCSVSNPALSGSETWIDTAGADEESDADLYGRAIAQWALLSVATPSAYYVAKAKAAAPTVTKVLVRDDNPNGPGTLELVLATGAGPASASDITLVESAMATQRSVGSGAITVVAATARSVDIGGTCYVAAPYRTVVRTAVATALAAYQAELDIGETVLGARIVQIVMSQAGVRDFDLPDDLLEDYAIGDIEIATLVHSITYVAE